MKRTAASFIACFLVFALNGLFGQTSGNASELRPDRPEIESAGSTGVEFINYEGPQDRIDSLADIKGIGAGLGRGISAASTRSGSDLRYQVIRAVDPKVPQGLDADIIVIGRDAQVDHIRNLRWIIAGYLVQAWGYSEKDAYTLAVFVTVYNAVHRGDMAYISSKYKSVVLRELSAENAGIALRWSEWPGKTRILIPLSSGAAKGKISAVDTSAVSGKEVTEAFKAQPDKGVPERQAMVDIKEREAEVLKAEAEKKEAEAAAAERKLAEDKAKLEADRAALEADKAKAESDKTAAASAYPPKSDTPTTTGTQTSPAQTGSPSTAELATKEAAVKAEEAKVAKAEAEVAAKKEEAAKASEAAAAKEAEAAQDRKDITADQKAVIAAEVEAKGRSEETGVYLVFVGSDANRLGQIMFVDSEKGSLIRKSRINTIHLRSFADVGDAFVAVSGLEGKPGGAKLVKLDKASLEAVAESKAEMYPESAILVEGSMVYAIVKAADGKYYPARFSVPELKEEARSSVAVMPHTMLSRVGSGIAVQTPAGTFAVLRTDNLEKTKDLKP